MGRRGALALVVAFALSALVSGACTRSDPAAGAGATGARGSGAAPGGAAASAVPLADSVVYTCEMAVVDRSATPFAQAEASAADEATARARAIPEACRKAGGGAACGGEEGGWETSVSCTPTIITDARNQGRKGWSCVATAVKGGVARVEAESPRNMDAACEMAHVAACEVARGGDDCHASKGGWQIFDRVRGKKIRTP